MRTLVGGDCVYSRRGEDTAGLWTLNAGYRFSPKAYLWADYARNVKADRENCSWQAEIDYGDYDDRPEKGAWSFFAAYRRFGYNTTFQGIMFDDAMRGTEGWAVGAKYAPFRNFGVLLKYFHGHTITTRQPAEKLFCRVEIFI